MASIFLSVGALTSVVGITAYYFYKHTPLPDGMDKKDQQLLRMLRIYQKIVGVVAQVGHFLGYDSNVNIHRRISKRLSRKHRHRTHIQCHRQTFDGVPVIIYRKEEWATDDQQRPAICYIHGGGWAFGHSEMYAALERRLVDELDVVLVSIDYRLAPEHPYPAAFNDCLTALKYLHQHSRDFGIDPSQIVLAGDSAGGNLTAAITLKLRDDGQSLLYRQVLISPVTQIVTYQSRAIRENMKYSILPGVNFAMLYMGLKTNYDPVFAVNGHTSDRMLQHKAWPYLDKYHAQPLSRYVRNEKAAAELEEKLMDPYMWPMMADSLADLPPALVLVSEFDLLRDDALAYADRLQADGTATTVINANGFHGVYAFPNSPSGGVMVQALIDYLKAALKKN